MEQISKTSRDDLLYSEKLPWELFPFWAETGVDDMMKAAMRGETVQKEDLPIDLQSSTALFRISQETLTNVARHSQATKLKVSLTEKNGQIEMTIKDNGIGISADQINNPKSYGLMGIKERILGLGGKSLIQGTKDKGTTVTVRIPAVKPVP